MPDGNSDGHQSEYPLHCKTDQNRPKPTKTDQNEVGLQTVADLIDQSQTEVAVPAADATTL